MYRGPVRGPHALVVGVKGHPVPPQVGHVEPFGMPDVCLEPHVFVLSAYVLLQQVAGATAVTSRRSFQLSHRLRLRTSCLEGQERCHCSWVMDMLYRWETIIIILFVIRKHFHSEAHEIHCNTYVFKIFIISLNVHVKMKC